MSRDNLAGNSSKRLPIVFCVDVSASMSMKNHGKSSIEILNESVNLFVNDLKKMDRTRAAVEIKFYTFASETEPINEDFESVSQISIPRFSTEKGGFTRMADAVIKAIDSIVERRQLLKKEMLGSYAPFLVILTDGNPSNNDDDEKMKKAMELVKKHCNINAPYSEIIVPFMIGIGDEINSETLKEFSAGFVDGFFHIRDDNKQVQFGKFFKLLKESTSSSVASNSNKDVIKTLQVGIQEFLDDIVNM